MFGDLPTSGPQRISFLLLDRFSMMALSSAIGPLRMANAISGRRLYEWTVLSVDGAPVRASNGMDIVATGNINSIQDPPMVVVCASYDPHLVASRGVLLWLARQARHGTTIGAIDTGSYVVAAAGLLDHHRATIHWEHLDSFAEQFPLVDAVQDIFVVDRNRFTCAGATTALDMSLHLVRAQHGHVLAQQVAEQFISYDIRDAGAPQRSDAATRLARHSPKLGKALIFMEHTMEEPLSTGVIASHVGLSIRALERQFMKWLQTTPAKYHRIARLEKARNLVRQTALPLVEISVRCGFSSSAHFSQSYKNFYGNPPSADRGYTRIMANG